MTNNHIGPTPNNDVDNNATGLARKWEWYRWRRMLAKIDRLENFEFVKLFQTLHRWQTPDLFSRERNERREGRSGNAKASRVHLNYLHHASTSASVTVLVTMSASTLPPLPPSSSSADSASH
jgi:hypothetical protein